MENCIFCKIINGKIPCNKIFEDSNTFAFLDINPVNKGHVLIIPKKHFETMTRTPDDILNKLFVNSKKLMTAIKIGTNADYVTLSVVGLDVPHFHIHLIPRFFNDGMASFWPTKKYDSDESIFVNKIISSIKS